MLGPTVLPISLDHMAAAFGHIYLEFGETSDQKPSQWKISPNLENYSKYID